MTDQITVGCGVWYIGGPEDPGFQLGPLAAIVASLSAEVENEPRTVNLAVLDRDGQAHARTNVKFYENDKLDGVTGSHCRWPEWPKDAPAAKKKAA